jgi:HPt (histidine-containing phosphotransfer) domain-containing protein
MEPWNKFEALAGVGGDEKFLDELAGVFCAACPTLLNSLEEFIALKRSESTADTAHLLCSTARNLAAKTVERAASDLEIRARREDFDGVGNAYQILREEAGRLMDELTKFRKERISQQ